MTHSVNLMKRKPTVMARQLAANKTVEIELTCGPRSILLGWLAGKLVTHDEVYYTCRTPFKLEVENLDKNRHNLS